MPPATPPKVLLDADVMSHFLKGGRASLLNDVFPGRLVILDTVMTELDRDKRFEQPLSLFVKLCRVEVAAFPTDDDTTTQEYAVLRRSFGPGESACMAVARYQSHYIASSNLRDIRAYCEQHRITYYTTFDILHLAVSARHLTVAECDEFIKQVRAANSRLPFGSYQEFLRANPRRP